MVRDTIRHAKWRGRMANQFITSMGPMGSSAFKAKTIQLYFSTNRKRSYLISSMVAKRVY
jgi:hypothetical protein